VQCAGVVSAAMLLRIMEADDVTVP
jgi:hypothetical protein